MRKKWFLNSVLTATFALSPALAGTARAQICDDVSGLIGKDMTITLKSGCVMERSAVISGNVTIKSDGGKPYTLTRGVGGNLIQLRKGATLTLENIVIDGGKQGSFSDGTASLVYVGGGASFIMNEGAVLQNNVALSGGGVFVENGGKFIMNDGKIGGNNAHAGGGVLIGNGSKFTMLSGEISGNASDIGGGVFMRRGGTFYMNGGAIGGNSASDFGGGVFVNEAGVFDMRGGEIGGNVANGVGGGVNVWGGEFTVTAGVICGNTAADGKGVFVYDGATFSDENGAVCNSEPQDSVSGDIAKKATVIDENAVPGASVNIAAGEFSAGPNPVSRTAGGVKFFHQGNQIRNCKLKVFNASGKVVGNVSISDKTVNGDIARRAVGSWNLKDSKGRLVSEGTYVVKGDLTTTDGKKQKISLTLGVR